MYIYPDNLKSKAVMWMWELKDIGIIAVCAIVSILVLTPNRVYASFGRNCRICIFDNKS